MVNLRMDKEEQRLEVLRKYDILDTPPDDAYDEIVNLAAELFEVPIALISLVDRNRIWFKSKFGTTLQQIDREEGLCATSISGNDVYVVENARTDFRTINNQLVKGSFGLQFYAAVPLITNEGYALGNLCVLDTKPREFSKKEIMILKTLGKIVFNQMDLQFQARMVIKNQSELSYLLTHNLKSFTNNIPTLIEVLREMKHDAEEFEKILHLMEVSAHKNSKEINEFLDKSAKNFSRSSNNLVKFDFRQVVKQVFKTNQIVALDKNQKMKMDLEEKELFILGDVDKLMDAVDNLINNSIKYSPYNSAITISAFSKGDQLLLKVGDEGPGLSEYDQIGLFKAFSRLSAQPTGGEVSSGIGLWIVKEIVASHKGRVWASSEGLGKGSTFHMELPLALS